MNSWIIPCNTKYYDVFGAFEKLKVLDWKQSNPNVSVGDSVFIYVGAPVMAVTFKCVVRKVNVPSIEIDDSEFIINGGPYVNYGRHMELELQRTYGEKELSRDVLESVGVAGRIMGPRRAPEAFERYVAELE